MNSYLIFRSPRESKMFGRRRLRIDPFDAQYALQISHVEIVNKTPLTKLTKFVKKSSREIVLRLKRWCTPLVSSKYGDLTLFLVLIFCSTIKPTQVV